MQNLLGQDLGRYHIVEQLGRGGMAVVYKAFDTRLERWVAIKVIRTGQFGSEVLEQVLQRFDREAKTLGKLNHPNIVSIHDYGEFEGAPYLVMDYIPSGTLKDLIGQPLPWPEAVKLILPIARALDYAHRNQTIHRDVKPSNILITVDGLPLLTDFGVAKILQGDENQTLTGTGVGIGTPEYMAPEQALGRLVDARVDIYALGIVLYELLTGEKPFTADTPNAVLLRQCSDPLTSPRHWVPGLPEAVEAVLYKALAKDPENRYPSMREFARAMEGLAKESPTGVESPSSGFHPEPLAPVVSPDATLVETPISPKPEETRVTSSGRPHVPRWAIFGGVLILLSILGAGALQWKFGFLNPPQVQPSANQASLTRATEAIPPTPSPIQPTQAIKTVTFSPSPVQPTPSPTSTLDLVLARKNATLFKQDFESGVAIGIYNQSQPWSISTEKNGNHVFCNKLYGDWQSFNFGLTTWTNYAIEMRVKLLKVNANQSGEIYTRIDSSMNGYRAAFAQEFANLSFYPPAQILESKSFITLANTWYLIRVEAAGNRIIYTISNLPIADIVDDRRSKGVAGFGISPNTQACVDDIHVWALTPDGQIAQTPPADQVSP